jgi:hypothetical protein
LFSGGLVINTPEVLGLWQLKGEFYPFSDNKLMASDRLQQDLSLGLLVLPGFQWNLRRDNGRYSAPHHFLKHIACHSFDFEDAHLFKNIDPEILRDDVRLRDHTSKSPSCAGCHSHLETMGAILNQQRLTREYHSSIDSTPLTFPFALAGHQIRSHEDLAAALGQDPRIQLCTIKNIWEDLTQRPFQASVDFTALHLAQQELLNEGSNNITAVVKRLLHSPAYGYDPEDGKEKQNTERTQPNLRFLHQQQYEKIFGSLLHDSIPLSISSNLNPGQEELGNHSDQIPSGEYFYALQKLAQIAAQEIVTNELINGSKRDLFTLLPDDYSDGQSHELVAQQIMMLWQMFTSEKLQPNSLQLQKLHQLWLDVKESAPIDPKEKSLMAWKNLLIAIFLSPEFFTY